jgi:LytS/YehU family sensor histidine kinase
MLVSFLVVAFLPDLIIPFEEFQPGRHRPGPKGSRLMFTIGHNIFFFLAVMFFSLMLKINNRLKVSEKEKLRAELSYFKAQINPHFLFNSLNTIYSLAIRQAGNTAEAVVKLSGMMRFVISDASQDYVSLEKEVAYVTDYIEFQKIRYGLTVRLEYEVENIQPGEVIAPLLLMPFIENAFKFGINPEEESLIRIDVRLRDSELHLHVFNRKVGHAAEPGISGGIGISNARHRLNLIYPEKHQLIIEESDADFKVDLFITLR